MNTTAYLVIQNNYDFIELALFLNNKCIDSVRESKMNASKMAVPLVKILLERNKYSFAQLDFVAVNQGPAPFTTLRVVIATANGISFATSLPLIGIDGLQALLAQHADQNYSVTVALLDAFNKDVYVAVEHNGQLSYTACENIEKILEKLSREYAEHKIRFVGGAAVLHADAIYTTFNNRAVIIETDTFCSAAQLGAMAHEKWQKKQDLSYQLFPLYLKRQQYKNQFGQMQTI